MTTETAEGTPLSEYQQRTKHARSRFDAIVAWHTEAHTQGDIELPNKVDSIYVDVTVRDYVRNEKIGEPMFVAVIDNEATLERLAKVAKFASKQGYRIEKKYESTFSLCINIADSGSDNEIYIFYTSNRDAVCTKKVVGTKVVPARTIPEYIEEVIEWDCEKISLLAQ